MMRQHVAGEVAADSGKLWQLPFAGFTSGGTEGKEPHEIAVAGEKGGKVLMAGEAFLSPGES